MHLNTEGPVRLTYLDTAAFGLSMRSDSQLVESKLIRPARLHVSAQKHGMGRPTPQALEAECESSCCSAWMRPRPPWQASPSVEASGSVAVSRLALFAA